MKNSYYTFLLSLTAHITGLILVCYLLDSHNENFFPQKKTAFRFVSVFRAKKAQKNITKKLSIPKRKRAKIKVPEVAKTKPKINNNKKIFKINKLENSQTNLIKAQARAKPKLISKISSQNYYPKRARVLGIEGKIKLRLKISPKGHVLESRILSGPGFGLRAQARKIVKKLVFLPATDYRGVPISAEIEHQIIFKLSDRSS